MAERKSVCALQRIFWGLFIVCFSLAFAGCFAGGASAWAAVLLAAAAVGLVWAAQCPKIPAKALLAVFGAGFAVTAGVQVWLAFNHYIVPYGFDMNAIYAAVEEMANTGRLADNSWYFLAQPFQSFLLAELYLFSHALMLLGMPTPLPYQAFTLLNALGIDLAILLFVATVRLLKGLRPALGVGLLCLLLSPLRYASVYIYTHTMAYPYLFAALFFMALAYKQAKRARQIIFFALGAVLLALGYLMAGAVLVVFAALIILAALMGRWRRWLAVTGILLAALLLVHTAFYTLWDNSGYLDVSQKDDSVYPIQHWFVMGLSGSGTYDDAALHEMASLPTRAEKTAFLNEKLWRLITEKGPGDWAALFWQKIRIAWGQFGGYVGYTPPLGQFIAQNLPPAFYLLMLAAALARLRRPKPDSTFFAALVLLGLYLFLLAYEVSNRVLLPYLMPMALVAAMGAADVLGLVMLRFSSWRGTQAPRRP